MENKIIEELFRKYYNEALLYTMSLCRDEKLAEDIVSEAFFKALSSAEDSIRNFKPWLLTVCRNEFMMHLRKEKRISDEELMEETFSVEDGTLERLIKYEEYRSLYRAISLLPVNYKEVIALYYFSDLSVKEIAALTEKSESNIKVILSRARTQLKRIMEEQ